MKFTDWVKLRENTLSHPSNVGASVRTHPSGVSLANSPSAVDQTIDYQGPARNGKVIPRGSPAGNPHSSNKIEQGRVQLGKLEQQARSILGSVNQPNARPDQAHDQLGKLAQDARSVLDYVNSSQYWKNYPQFQKAFLEKMRNAVDGFTQAQAVVGSHQQNSPQFQKAFLEKMRNAVDGLTQAQAIISADSSYKRSPGDRNP